MRWGLACLVMLAGCDRYFNTSSDDDCVYDQGFIAPEVRNPDTGQCEAGNSGTCIDTCTPCVDVPARDWGACTSDCNALDENGCIAATGCHAIYDANTNVDEPAVFAACWAIAPSGPDPGGCDNLGAYDCSRHDNCAAYYDIESFQNGTTTMHFVSCRAEVAPDACADLADETACNARGDCRAVYTGDDCTCDVDGNCSCQLLTYAHCESAP